MPYETGANELAYQRAYAKKKKFGKPHTQGQSLAQAVVGAGPGKISERDRSGRRAAWRKAVDSAVKGGGDVSAPQKSTGEKIASKVGSLQVVEKERKNLSAIEEMVKKARKKAKGS